MREAPSGSAAATLAAARALLRVVSFRRREKVIAPVHGSYDRARARAAAFSCLILSLAVSLSWSRYREMLLPPPAGLLAVD